MFTCQPPTPRSAPASWKCSETSTASGLSACIVARIIRATSCVWSCAPYRPVMLATSMRQPSRSYGSRIHRPITESGPSTMRAASAGRGPVELGQRRVLEPADVPGGRRRSSSRTRPPRWSGRPGRARTTRGPAPVWLVVRSPTSRIPRACTRGRQGARAPRRRRAAGRRGRTCWRRSGGWTAPGTPASGTGCRRRGAAGGRAATRSPAGHRRSSCCAAPRPSAAGSSSHGDRLRPVGQRTGGRAVWPVERANRSGNTW